MPASQIVLVTGASSGFGRMTAESLARAGHTVLAGMRATTGRNAEHVAALDTLTLATSQKVRFCATSTN